MSNTTSSTGTGTIAMKWSDSVASSPSFFSESSLSWSIPLLLLILCVCITPVIVVTRKRCEYQNDKEQDIQDADASRLARGLAEALANTRPDPLRGTAEYEAQRAEEAKRRQQLHHQQHQHQTRQLQTHATKIQILNQHGASSSASSFHEQPHVKSARQGSIQYPEYSTIPSMNVLEIDDDVLIEIEQEVDRELRSMNMLVAASVDDAHVITVEPSKLKEMLATQETLVMEQRKLRAQRRSQKLNTGTVKQLTLCIPQNDQTTPSPSPSASPYPTPSYVSPAATTHVDSSNNDARRFLSPDIEMTATASRVITYTTRPSPMSSRNGSMAEDEHMHMIRSQLFSSSGGVSHADGELVSPTASPTGSIHQIRHPHSPATSDIDQAQM